MKVILKSTSLLMAALIAAPLYGQALGEEQIPDGEDQDMQTVTSMIDQSVRAAYEADPSLARRDAHAKAHGCVKATFSVDADLATHLQTSVMKPNASYQAWIRYSNGSGRSQDDNDGDGRGMAIKLMGVPGPKLEADESATLDLLMINHPAFFVRNVADYVDFTRATQEAGNPIGFFFPSLFPTSWRLHELSIARAIQAKVVHNPLAVPYWSMTPYRWGAAGSAVKFSAFPCDNGGNGPASSSPDKLKEAMAATLSSQEACFVLYVQSQTDPVLTPIEDPTIEWTENQAPYERVATITIPQQTFTSSEQQDFCEHISLNPWHATEDHRPLGGINRARRVVYQTISNLRHELNGVATSEPQVSP